MRHHSNCFHVREALNCCNRMCRFCTIVTSSAVHVSMTLTELVEYYHEHPVSSQVEHSASCLMSQELAVPVKACTIRRAQQHTATPDMLLASMGRLTEVCLQHHEVSYSLSPQTKTHACHFLLRCWHDKQGKALATHLVLALGDFLEHSLVLPVRILHVIAGCLPHCACVQQSQ